MAFPSAAQKSGDPDFLQPYNPASFQHVHGQRTAEQAFLFRIDPLPAGRAMILVQSALMPDWDYAFNNADYLLAEPRWQVRQIDLDFTAGRMLRFRLAANPVKRLRKESIGPDGKPVNNSLIGKRVPVPTSELEQWLSHQSSNSGFEIEHLEAIQPGYIYFSKGRNAVQESEQNGKQEARLLHVLYEGILKVTEPEMFAKALMSGIGPAKGFGFGLLSVTPVKGL
jgi:CRISPR system Cascade subunit CasE